MDTIIKWVLGTFVWVIISAPHPSFAQVIQPIERLAVFDTNGTRVGPVVTLNLTGGAKRTDSIQFVFVPLVIDDFVYIVRIDGLQPSFNLQGNFWGNASVFFSSVDCTGQHLMLTQAEASERVELSFAVIGDGSGSGNMIWRPDPSAVPFPAGTSVQSVNSKNSKECLSGPFPSPGTMIVNAIQVINLDSVFTPPFTLLPDVAPKKGQGPKK